MRPVLVLSFLPEEEIHEEDKPSIEKARKEISEAVSGMHPYLALIVLRDVAERIIISWIDNVIGGQDEKAYST